MKKLLFFTIVLITALGFTIFNLYSYYAPPLEHQPYIIKQKSDDTLHIAYIGDSWAFMHKNHNCQISKIIGDSLQIPVVVHSFGICGITSKEFYESIFYNSSLTQFLQKRNYSCCFISLGINFIYPFLHCLVFVSIRYFSLNHGFINYYKLSKILSFF